VSWVKTISIVVAENEPRVLIDSNDEIYVIGTSRVANSPETVNVVKMGADGVFKWKQNVGSLYSSVCIDGNDNMYFVVQAQSAPFKMLVVCYDKNGTKGWEQEFGTGNESAPQLVLGSSSLYIVGRTDGSYGTIIDPTGGGGGETDLFVTKMNVASGGGSSRIVWEKRIGGTGVEDVPEVAADGSDNLIIVATSTGGGGLQDILVAKVESNGFLPWRTVIGGTGNEEVPRVVVDAANNIYVAAITDSSGGGGIGGDVGDGALGVKDVFVCKLSSSAGVIQWNKLVGSSGSEDQPRLLLNTQNNTVCIVATTDGSYGSVVDGSGGGLMDVFVSVLGTETGDFRWTRRIGSNAAETVPRVALDTKGNLYVVGVTEGGYGSVQIGEVVSSGITKDIFLTKIDPAGNITWSGLLGGDSTDDVPYIMLDSKDTVHLVAATDGSYGLILDMTEMKSKTAPRTFTRLAKTPQYILSAAVNVVPSDYICFPAGTPVQTDTGPVAVEKLRAGVHTIDKQRVCGVSKSITPELHLVCFEAHSLGRNVPSQRTIMSLNHKVRYRGLMLEASNFLNGQFKLVFRVKNTGEVLYNVILDTHSCMVVNNMVVETLNPTHAMAKMFKEGF
jgi:hypothetical protein